MGLIGPMWEAATECSRRHRASANLCGTRDEGVAPPSDWSTFHSAFAAADEADEDALAFEAVGFDVGVARVGGAEDGAAAFDDVAF
jgi:hypothetical protein